jgi:hypothetical protein
MRTASSVFVVLALSAFSAHAADEGPALVFDGLKLSPTNANTKLKSVQVKADGSITGDGKALGKIAHNEIKDPAGATVYKVLTDGTVTGAGVNKKIKFNDKDELVGEGGLKITIAEDGTATLDRGGKSEPAPLKIEGVSAKNRRAAILLVSYLLFTPAKTTSAK